MGRKISKISYEFDPFILAGMRAAKNKISKRNMSKLQAEVAEYVIDEILQNVGDATSPVAGRGSFKGLSPSYRKEKAKFSSSVIANMELHGDMLDALKARKNGDKIEVGIFDYMEAQKADGHNHFSAASINSKNPTRRFIPKKSDGETFNSDIIDGIRDIIEDYANG